MELTCKVCSKQLKVLDENNEYEKKIIDFIGPYYPDRIFFFCNDEHNFENYSLTHTPEELQFYKSQERFYELGNFEKFEQRFFKRREIKNIGE